jgi:methenyltetrahydromethanopterin cyclohydrolase
MATHLNQRAAALARTISDAQVIDLGVNERGSLTDGITLARICMADLADVRMVPGQVTDKPLPLVTVNVRQPVAACMASQYAGWQISVNKYFAMGSGPFRAIYGREKLYDDIGCRETSDVAVGVLETSKLPDAAVIEWIAGKLDMQPSQIILLCARTASLAGGVQIAARSVETAMHKLHELDFDLHRVVSGYGSAPLPPVAKDDMAAIGRTNDAVLYGAQVSLFVTGDDDTLRDAGEKLPSSASRDYGKPFGEIFAGYDHDFYKIDPMLFSPAEVMLHNIDTGRVHHFGKVDHDILARSFFA